MKPQLGSPQAFLGFLEPDSLFMSLMCYFSYIRSPPRERSLPDGCRGYERLAWVFGPLPPENLSCLAILRIAAGVPGKAHLEVSLRRLYPEGLSLACQDGLTQVKAAEWM